MRKPDRPKTPQMRRWCVLFDDGATVEVEAEYRGMARHYAKSLAPGFVGSYENYRRVKSARLVR